MFDCIIIGAGISGCSLAFELSKYKGKVLWFERNNDVANETTKANSAIIHAGYDPMPNTMMAKYNVEGNKIIPKLCKDLDVPCQNIGSLVVGFNKEDDQTIQKLYDRGIQNGVQNLKIIKQPALSYMEPNLNPKCTSALYAPSACIINPWQFAIVLSEVAVSNGVKLCLNEEVTSIKKEKNYFLVNNKYQARIVVNCAGVQCNQVTGLVHAPDYTIIPNKGEYYLLDKSQSHLVSHVIFQCPTKTGKGVLVAPTVDGNLIVGPTSENCDETDYSTSSKGLRLVKENALKSIPNIDFKENIRIFAGIRARSNANDFIVGEDKEVSNFFSIAGMASPGLSSASAAALDIVKKIQEKNYFTSLKKRYISTRKVTRLKELSHAQRQSLISKQPEYGRIICRCEMISEGEIVDAIHRCPKPCSLDGIKRRCNAGMGRCQSGFCGPRVQEILARELGVSQLDIELDKKGSYILTSRTKEDDHE